jgi:hypothetical protein
MSCNNATYLILQWNNLEQNGTGLRRALTALSCDEEKAGLGRRQFSGGDRTELERHSG